MESNKENDGTSVDPPTPEHPLLSSLPEKTRALAKQHPSLVVPFSRFVSFLDLLQRDSWDYEKLLDSLKIAYGYTRVGQGISHLCRLLGMVDFVAKCVELQRQIMQQRQLDYLTEVHMGLDQPPEIECLKLMRSLFLNFSSSSMEFRQHLAESGVLRDFLEDIKHMVHLTAKALEDSSLHLFSMGTIHNCCRNPQVVPVLRKLGAVDLLKVFVVKEDKSLTRAISLMSLAYLVDDSQLDLLEATPGMVQFFMRLIQGALDSNKDDFEGWVTNEILAGLSLLARNDFNKRLLVATGAMKPICTILHSQKRSNDEKESAIHIAEVLARDQENARIFKRDKELLKTIKNLQKSESQKIRESAVEVLSRTERTDSEKVQTSGSDLLDDLMADSLNALSILDVGEVEYVLERLGQGSNGVTLNFSTVDLLRVLGGLAEEESRRREIFARGGVDPLNKVLERGSSDEQLQAANVLLALAAQREYSLILQLNTRLVERLRSLTETDDSSVGEAAKKCLVAINSFVKPPQIN